MNESFFVIDPLLNIQEPIAHWGIESMEFEGVARVTTGQTVAISGKFTGRIESNGCVIICKTATIFGTVQAAAMQIDGKITKASGDDLIKVFGPVVIGEQAEINCDIQSNGLKMAYGAVVNAVITNVS